MGMAAHTLPVYFGKAYSLNNPPCSQLSQKNFVLQQRKLVHKLSKGTSRVVQLLSLRHELVTDTQLEVECQALHALGYKAASIQIVLASQTAVTIWIYQITCCAFTNAFYNCPEYQILPSELLGSSVCCFPCCICHDPNLLHQHFLLHLSET